MSPDLTDEKITATCDVRGTTFARFGVSGWYWWNGVTWGVLPSPLHIEPMLDTIVARNAEVDQLTGEKEELRALIASCDSDQASPTCHLKLRLIRDAMRAQCTQRRECVAIDHEYGCPMGGRP